MLTDAFFRRYQNVPMWTQFGGGEIRLMGQLAQLLTQEVHKRDEAIYKERSKDPAIKALQASHDMVARELGVEQLSPKYWTRTYSTPAGQQRDAIAYLIERQLSNFFTANCDFEDDVDLHMKYRVSVVELAFRLRAEHLKAGRWGAISFYFGGDEAAYEALDASIIGGSPRSKQKRSNQLREAAFADQVEELNTRFRQSDCRLSYHNGFIQISDDQLSQKEVEKPFWALVSDVKWVNVDLHMKEAIDKRDRGERDAAFTALQALESVVKIISDDKGWTTGKEKGAHNYIDNIASKANGNWIADWERDALKAVFSEVRNPFGHGPGNQPMPALKREQTDWAIDSAMTWIKSLVRRT